VIAMDLGSCREVIADGVTGFLARDVDGAATRLDLVPRIDRAACRRRVKERFSMETMVEHYERAYRTVLESEATKVV
jgi:glycosyltransferase involved in cell wall biosynthesis